MKVKDLVVSLRDGKIVKFNFGVEPYIIEEPHCLTVYDRINGKNYKYPWNNVISFSFKIDKEEGSQDE